MNSPQNISFVPYIYSIMTEQKVLITYLGEVTPQITNILLKAVKDDKSSLSTSVVVRKKIYKIIVECLENIMRHNEVREKVEEPSIFLLGKDNDNYYVITGNYVYEEQGAKIKSALDKINGLSRDEVKQVYSDKLSKGEISEKGGAGLGIIDIAMKSGKPLFYDFISVDNGIQFFILKVQVSIN